MEKFMRNLSKVEKRARTNSKTHKISENPEKSFKNSVFFEKSFQNFQKLTKSYKNIENTSGKEASRLGALDGASAGQKFLISNRDGAEVVTLQQQQTPSQFSRL